MSVLDEILKHNAEFVEKGDYKKFQSDVTPNKKLAIVSCMDSRLTELLPAALNLKNGDAKIIKNAGAVLSHPFGSAMRSLLVSVYELGVEEIMVIGHTCCGMHKLDTDKMVENMINRGIPKNHFDMLKYCNIDIYNWLKGFDNIEDSIRNSVNIIKEHLLMPKNVSVYGFVIDIETGKLTKVD